MPSQKPFLGMNIDEQLLKKIDDFRWNNRFPSRAQAIEVILRAGMTALSSDYPELDLNVKLETGKKEKVDGVTDEKRIHLRAEG